jgi:signal transduction histidine kinase
VVPEESIVRRTLRALLEPRRLVPILLVSFPLVYGQRTYSRDPHAVHVAVALCLTFVLVAPVSYRVLFPEGLEWSHGAIRALLYAAIGAGSVLTMGLYVPRLFGVGDTFLTHRASLPIDVALFLVGGWGLGRDIDLGESLARERRRAAELAAQAEHAQLLALRAQLDPHFLFNTLNAIAEWCRTDGETAEKAVLELSRLLRAVLVGIKETSWPLERELDLGRTLLSLHLRRDPQMFALEWSVSPEAAACPVPPLLVLPLVENAVKHGPAKGHRGVLSVSATREGDRITVCVENAGPYGGPREGSHGLPTVERRLALAYGGAAKLEIGGTAGRTRAVLVLPANGPERPI